MAYNRNVSHGTKPAKLDARRRMVHIVISVWLSRLLQNDCDLVGRLFTPSTTKPNVTL